jgi:hypothetical protein
MVIRRRKKTKGGTSSNATLPSVNLTRNNPELNSDLRGEKPASNRLAMIRPILSNNSPARTLQMR